MADRRDPDKKKLLRHIEAMMRQIERLQAQMQALASEVAPERDGKKPNRFDVL